jgi:hypothetical protein
MYSRPFNPLDKMVSLSEVRGAGWDSFLQPFYAEMPGRY